MPGLRLELICVPQRKYGGSEIRRYDGTHPKDEKFDDIQRDNPTDDEQYRRYTRYSREHGYPSVVPGTLEGLCLADINLRTRARIGLLLGSLIPEVRQPPRNIRSLNAHPDVDVLILQPHSRQNPKPNEWGIDWWVRPENQMPTNGRVQTWYDIGLNPDVVPATTDQSKLSLSLDPKTQRVRYEPSEQSRVYSLRESTRDDIGKIVIPAGLYIPDEEMQEAIINHCEAHSQERKREGIELYNRLKRMAKNLKLGDKNVVSYILEEIINFEKKHKLKLISDGFDLECIKLGNFYSQFFIERISESLSNKLDTFKEKLIEQRTSFKYLRPKRHKSKATPLAPTLASDLLTFRHAA